MIKSYRLGEIAEQLQLELHGDANILIQGIAPLETAKLGQISFLTDKKLERFLANSQASAVIVKQLPEALENKHYLLSDNPYLSFAKLTALFNDAPSYQPGIHPTAEIHESVQLGKQVYIGANVHIAANTVIGDYCVIKANTTISERCVLGDNCLLHSNVTLYHNVILGDQVTIHSGAVLGADGFGFAPQPGQYKWQKIYQLGGVRIGSQVEIGANSCIDRGALADTIVHDGVIIDNLVHIAHNCEVGANSALAAYVGVAGSVKIGENCTFAGKVGISGHLEITDNCHFAGMTVVTGTVKESGAYATGTSMMPVKEWRKSAVRFSQLNEMHARIKKLEKIIEEQSSLNE